MKIFDLTDVPAFKSNLEVHSLEDDTMLVASSRERSLVTAKHSGPLVDLIDGQRNVEALLEAVRGRIPAPYALHLLQQLASLGLLVAKESEGPSPTTAYWDDAGFDGAGARRALKATAVAVLSVGGSPELVDEMRRALEACEIAVDRDSRRCVVVTRDYLDPALSHFNERAREEGRSWYLVKPVTSQTLVGPWFDPETATSPCWECLAFWVRGNRPVDELLLRLSPNSAAARRAGLVGSPNSLSTACGMAAQAIAQSIVAAAQSQKQPLFGKLLAFDFSSFQGSFHAVTRRPQCPCCGESAQAAIPAHQPVELAPVNKQFSADGGYRLQTPRATFERLQHLISPLTGAVTYVTPVPDELDALRPVFASSYLVCPRDEPTRNNAFDKPCAGKGRTPEQARTSALCEALERFSGVYRGDEARIRASRSELGAPAIAPEDLQNFSDAQYRAAETQTASSNDLRRWIPRRLGAHEAIDWSPAWSLTHNERRYVPLSYCYAESPPACGTRFAGTCGNGVAAGNCLEEAILQGLLELVERDAAAVWWYNELRRPSVDLTSFEDPWFDALRRDYAARGVEVWALDLTHDLGLGCCVAVGYHAATGKLYLGFGCHLNGRLAVQRALTELNQIYQLGGSGRSAPFQFHQLALDSHLRPCPSKPSKSAAELPHTDGADLLSDIRFCVDRLACVGLDVAVVNKTRPDIQLNVAQVVVPGLRHFWPRFGPGRLYQVPLEMGWVELCRTEAQLNPLPLFL